MTFKVIDKKTGKEPTSRVIRNIAKEGGLMIMDIDQFFVGEYGSLVLADHCGNIAYCDTKRFKVIAEQEPIILRVNEKQLEKLKELIHDNPLCVAMAEPKTGQWEETRYRSYDPQSCETYDDGMGFRCSNCANVFKVTSLARYHYCPNCGAKMEG